MRTAIVTDSSACLPDALARALRITVVPIAYQVDGQTFRDGDVPPREFYRRLRVARDTPTTQAPAPGDFLTAFRDCTAAGSTNIVCITLPESYSGTYQAAVAGANLAADSLPGTRITVIDSGGLALVHGFAVLAAARAVAQGGDEEVIANRVREVVARTRLAGALESTRFLAKSGRVPLIFHWAASALSLRPLFAAEGVATRSLGAARTRDAAVSKLVSYVSRSTEPGAPLCLGVMHADAPDGAQGLLERLLGAFTVSRYLVTEFTPVMGIHTGPGLLAVAFHEQ